MQAEECASFPVAHPHLRVPCMRWVAVGDPRAQCLQVDCVCRGLVGLTKILVVLEHVPCSFFLPLLIYVSCISTRAGLYLNVFVDRSQTDRTRSIVGSLVDPAFKTHFEFSSDDNISLVSVVEEDFARGPQQLALLGQVAELPDVDDGSAAYSKLFLRRRDDHSLSSLGV
eukprot:748167-Hanusia_phi.AAC.1